MLTGSLVFPTRNFSVLRDYLRDLLWPGHRSWISTKRLFHTENAAFTSAKVDLKDLGLLDEHVEY